MKIELKITSEQIAYLKSLDSKKKKREFLLDCLLEEITNKQIKKLKKGFSKSIDEFLNEDSILRMNNEAMGLTEQGCKLMNFGDFENDVLIKWDINKLKQAQKELENSVGILKIEECEKTDFHKYEIFSSEKLNTEQIKELRDKLIKIIRNKKAS